MKFLWTGTDSLMLINYSMRRFMKKIYWWCFRRFVRVGEFFIQEHYCDVENVADNLREFGVKKTIKVVPDHMWYPDKMEKIPHEEFNVLYYMPNSGDQQFMKWLYGYDIFLAVRKHFAGTNVRFRVIGGKVDMTIIFPLMDFYLRPNRHDGASRLRQECEIQEIPYYWTQKDPSAEDAIKDIEKIWK